MSGLIPTLSSEAGSCLTLANWEQAGVKTVSYRIDALLMKPGLSVLKNLQGLRNYFDWQGSLIINAALPPPDQAGIYSFRSIYDGSLIQIDIRTLFELIIRLEPEKIILPQESANYYNELWQHLPSQIVPYFSLNENLPGTYANKAGRYLLWKKQTPFSLFVDEKVSAPLYIVGDFELAQMKELIGIKNLFLESDKPAKDGMAGWVYSNHEILNILDKSMLNQHQPIDSNCQCQTCSGQFTRAYLHHLLQHTPLLAQRLLIQHNVYIYIVWMKLHLRASKFSI